MADRLVTPEELASALQQDLDRSTTELLIEGATAAVQALVSQRLVRGTSTAVVEPLHGGFLDLPERPVVSVESVTIGAELLAAEDYTLVGDRLFRYSGWRSYGYHGFAPPVTVEYTHGFASGDQALELARSATLSIAAAAYSNPAGATRDQIGDVSLAFEASVSALDASPFLRTALLRRYGAGAGLITLGRAQ